MRICYTIGIIVSYTDHLSFEQSKQYYDKAHGTCRICEKRKVERTCANFQASQSLHSLHAQRQDVDIGTVQNVEFKPF